LKKTAKKEVVDIRGMAALLDVIRIQGNERFPPRPWPEVNGFRICQ